MGKFYVYYVCIFFTMAVLCSDRAVTITMLRNNKTGSIFLGKQGEII